MRLDRVLYAGADLEELTGTMTVGMDGEATVDPPNFGSSQANALPCWVGAVFER